MIKEFLKSIIFFFIGNLIYLFFPLIIGLRKNSIFVLNYHATYPDKNKNFIKQILFFKKYFDLDPLRQVIQNCTCTLRGITLSKQIFCSTFFIK